MISCLRSCKQKFSREYIQHWKPKSTSVHLHAGAAFASGLEAVRRAYYQDNKGPSEALAHGLRALIEAYGDYVSPPDSAKSLERMAGALEFYFSVWPLETDPARPLRLGDRLGIEFSFANPLPVNHPETGEPLIYCGRADQVVSFAGGQYVEDDKTASQLGASWASQWDLRSQFTGYCWAAGAAGIRVDGVLVRGVSILKTKYGSAESVTYRPEWQVQRWLSQVTRDLQTAIRCWEEGYWDYSLDHACTEYGGCTFAQICRTPPENQDAFLDINFERREWNPLLRTERLIEQTEG